VNKLKTELLMLGRSYGDTGDNATQRAWIDIFFEELQVFLTPEGIETFTVQDLRLALLEFTNLYIKNNDRAEAREGLGLLLHIKPYPRDKPLQIPLSSSSVVDIFRHKA
jgi:hypothetical protein